MNFQGCMERSRRLGDREVNGLLGDKEFLTVHRGREAGERLTDRQGGVSGPSGRRGEVDSPSGEQRG